ncbi:putative acylphosphatase 2 [Babesia bovis T2Bo]|uniref:acylphosphatase n=1 Tax=Babesia bovis TaxID=5865 RepID=A7ASJ8_BABBO|nr:putative acylphosphatase 2 [Babesia bovis T2Bo]EDO07517.1 putative acylphosphatase 2 [Babesia bovis T2Bo]BAN64515.1 acylphosphatase, putative [Babesia bovis]|eukprot:XP_001611085.1 acylphosphatase [Babesia bovis T2Bo]
MTRIYVASYRVYGRVQGVFFRKYTKQEADKLGIRGFVKNDNDGTVFGQCQSHNVESMNAFRQFLEKVGSPNSEIKSCDFAMSEKTGDFDYDSFDIIR